MATQDTCCTIVPYFSVHEGKMDAFKKLCDHLVKESGKEPGCLFYGFSFNGSDVHCREGYANADGLLAHVQDKMGLIQEALAMSELTRLEVHGPAAELTKLKEPLAPLNPQYWELEYGYRK